MVERLDGAADFVVALRVHAGVQVARGQFGQPRRQLLDGPADAVRQIHQQRQRHQPEGRGQQNVDQLDPAPQVALPGRCHQRAGIADLAREALHGDFAQVGGIHPDSSPRRTR